MKLTALLCCVALASNAAPLVLHVATNGNDNASGTARAPLASLPGGLKTARQKRVANEPVSILLHRGTFVLTEPIKLSPADSGLTIAAAENAKPIISGGHRITGWKNVSSNLWQTTIDPEASESTNNWFYVRQLFIDGRRATVARTPNEGSFFRMVGERFSDKPAQFRFRPGDIAALDNERTHAGGSRSRKMDRISPVHLERIHREQRRATLRQRCAAHARSRRAIFHPEYFRRARRAR